MTSTTLPISQSTHDSLLRYVERIQVKQKDFSTFIDKLEAIDIAYARHKQRLEDDPNCAKTIGTQPVETAIKVPIVNSEVDSVTSHLAKVFLSQRPLFPVLAESGNEESALALQTLISRNARYQRWARHLLKFITLASRYNIAGLEIEKIMQSDLSISNGEEVNQVETEVISASATKVYALDMYNALFDYRVEPADVATEGDYGGYNKIISKMALKKYGNMLSKEKKGYNLREAYDSTLDDANKYWNNKPDITDTEIRELNAPDEVDWFEWASILDVDADKLKMAGSSYLFTRIYLRIIPNEFNLFRSAHPIIIKLSIVNMKHIIEYEEVQTPLDALPILFCDLEENGFGYQTKSAGENVLPYQETATELLSIRIQGSKRSLSDRAVYDASYVDSKHVNMRGMTNKIPLKKKLANSGERIKPSEVYWPIPFESQGTIGAIGDMQTILQLKDHVNGSTHLSRGETLPGNRTLGEVQKIDQSTDNKQAVKAIRMEDQVWIFLKLFVKSNILQSTIIEDKALDPDTGMTSSVNIAKLRQVMTEYKLTDGLLPKSAMQNPNVLSTALQFMQNSPELNQRFDVTSAFVSMMALLDIDMSKHQRQMGDQNGTNANGATQNSAASTGTNTGT